MFSIENLLGKHILQKEVTIPEEGPATKAVKIGQKRESLSGGESVDDSDKDSLCSAEGTCVALSPAPKMRAHVRTCGRLRTHSRMHAVRRVLVIRAWIEKRCYY